MKFSGRIWPPSPEIKVVKRGFTLIFEFTELFFLEYKDVYLSIYITFNDSFIAGSSFF